MIYIHYILYVLLPPHKLTESFLASELLSLSLSVCVCSNINQALKSYKLIRKATSVVFDAESPRIEFRCMLSPFCFSVAHPANIRNSLDSKSFS